MTGEDPRFHQSILDASKDVLIEFPFILPEVNGGHIGVRAGVDQKDIGVIITDTCGRAFRHGQTGNAIGWSGMPAIRDFRRDKDLFGHVLKFTEEAIVDEIAGIANFVMGESNNGVPAVVVKGCERWSRHDNLYFTKQEDFIRRALCVKAKPKKKE